MHKYGLSNVKSQILMVFQVRQRVHNTLLCKKKFVTCFCLHKYFWIDNTTFKPYIPSG